ncbi:MAG: fibronectin type III domain-containing protein, partial [Acidimicrobiales bacterium]
MKHVQRWIAAIGVAALLSAFAVMTPTAGATTTATPPGAPTGLTATPGNGTITLHWTAPANTGGSPIEGYNVYLGNQGPGSENTTYLANGSYEGSVLVTGTSVTISTAFQCLGFYSSGGIRYCDSYSYGSLTNNTTYYLYVTAVNAVGESSPSNEAAT